LTPILIQPDPAGKFRSVADDQPRRPRADGTCPRAGLAGIEHRRYRRLAAAPLRWRSQRANSVSTIDFVGNDPEAAVADVEQWYRQRGAVAQFQTFDETSPADLPAILRARGYHENETTVTVFKPAECGEAPAGITVRDHPWPDPRTCYLGEVTQNRRAVNAEIVAQIPGPRVFFGYRWGERIISMALCVVGFGCAVVECVTTRADERRQGAARSILIALEAWAAQQSVGWIGLQVTAANPPAVRLCEQLGFVPGATNRFWVVSADTGKSLG
jgi:N-acetylglutamate synthase